MALNASQKADVIFYLGYPGKTLVENSTNYNRTTAQLLENLTEYIEAQVRSILDKLRTQDQRLEDANDRVVALEVGDIKINPEEIDRLKSERLRLIKMLSRLLDIPVVNSSGVMFGVRV